MNLTNQGMTEGEGRRLGRMKSFLYKKFKDVPFNEKLLEWIKDHSRTLSSIGRLSSRDHSFQEPK